jgi:hypothetical protein
LRVEISCGEKKIPGPSLINGYNYHYREILYDFTPYFDKNFLFGHFPALADYGTFLACYLNS